MLCYHNITYNVFRAHLDVFHKVADPHLAMSMNILYGKSAQLVTQYLNSSKPDPIQQNESSEQRYSLPVGINQQQ